MPEWRYIRYDIVERWERITERLRSPREWVNRQNPKVMLGIAGFCLVILVVIGIGQLRDGKVVTRVGSSNNKSWFYDLNTGRLFTERSDKLPPFEVSSGPLANGEPAGVRAYVFSYSDQPNDSNRFIGYLEKLTPRGKELMATFLKSRSNLTRESVIELSRERLVRSVEGKQWFASDSNEGKAVISKGFSPNKKGKKPQFVLPE